jgi:RNA polymerase sigma factor (sigma-70 family)
LLRRLQAAADPTPDGELARRFYALGDQDAFELLARRHAATVVHICRSILGDPHLAEDAAQAVFLVLARKAKTVAGVRSAAGWLARVAYRAANRTRARAASRATLPLDAAAVAVAGTPDPADVASANERAAVVQREVSRLPDRYLAPIVLCYYEGLTMSQAAERLGWAAGTVAGRLARARSLLRGRLAHHGVTVPAAGLAMLFGRPEPAAAVCHRILDRSAVPPGVGELASDVVTAMGTTRRTSGVAVAMLTLLGLVVAAGAGDPPAKPPANDPPPAAAPRNSEFIVVGKVFDADGKAPMEGVKVWASSGNGTLKRTGETTTDKDGKFRLVFGPGLLMAGGKVGGQVAVVWAAKPGYYAWTYGTKSEFMLLDSSLGVAENNAIRQICLSPGEEARLEFRMAPAAALKVKLVSPDGKPLTNYRVWLTGKDLPPASSVIAGGQTDASGEWLVRDVPRHRYRLVIDDPREKYGELELGSIRFADPVEYTAVATVSMFATETSVSLKVTRPSK